MMDVSDGLLLDAERMASASKAAITIDLANIPLSAAYRQQRGDSLDSRLQAASWGDDYQLIFTAQDGLELPIAATAVGRVIAGSGLSLTDAGAPIPLPPTLGYQHR
jgi:thiamine-monophosphate kinase